MTDTLKKESKDTTDTGKKKPGTYDHTEVHTQVYSHMGVNASDTPIDRAWARLYDKGINAGPAIGKPFLIGDTTERQIFLYAVANRDLSEENVNLTTVFTFPPGVEYSESGL